MRLSNVEIVHTPSIACVAVAGTESPVALAKDLENLLGRHAILQFASRIVGKFDFVMQLVLGTKAPQADRQPAG